MKVCSCGTVMKKGVHCEQGGAKSYYSCPKCKNRIYKRKKQSFKEILKGAVNSI